MWWLFGFDTSADIMQCLQLRTIYNLGHLRWSGKAPPESESDELLRYGKDRVPLFRG